METLPDPGSRRAARLALVLSGVLFITVAVLQTLGGKQALAPKPDAAYTLPAPNEGSQLLESRMAMGLFDLLGPESKKSIGEPPGAVVESPPNRGRTSARRQSSRTSTASTPHSNTCVRFASRRRSTRTARCSLNTPNASSTRSAASPSPRSTGLR
jgi:hypothetical protein